MNNNGFKTLQLSKITLRNLSTTDAHDAAGGAKGTGPIISPGTRSISHPVFTNATVCRPSRGVLCRATLGCGPIL